MNRKEFAIALQVLIESQYLERVAAALTPFGEPKDIVQDVLFNLLELLPEECSNIRDLKRYAAQAVRHRCFELARRKRREPPLAKLDEVEEGHLIQPLEASSRLGDPYQIYEQEQLRKRVHESMDMLKPLERVVLRLAHLEGESGPAIASRLQLSEHVVRGNRERARKKMKIFLTDLLESDCGGGSGMAGKKSVGMGRDRGGSPEGCWAVILRDELTPILSSFHEWLDRTPGHRPIWVRLDSD